MKTDLVIYLDIDLMNRQDKERMEWLHFPWLQIR
jgi:hypothetical protein